MTEYPYTKSTVNSEMLTKEINNSGITSASLVAINWNAPESLIVIFDGDLSSGDEDTLDGLVASHTGAASNTYRMLCEDCSQHTFGRNTTTPTTCPICEGSNISGVVQQAPYELMKDEDGDLWGHFQNSTGTIITAKWGDN